MDKNQGPRFFLSWRFTSPLDSCQNPRRLGQHSICCDSSPRIPSRGAAMAKCSAQLARIAGAAGIWWEDFWRNLGLKFLGVVAIIPKIALTIGGSYTSSVSKGARIRRFCGFVYFGRLSGRGVVCCVITWESVGQRGQLDRFFCQSKAFLATRSQSFQQNHSRDLQAGEKKKFQLQVEASCKKLCSINNSSLYTLFPKRTS